MTETMAQPSQIIAQPTAPKQIPGRAGLKLTPSQAGHLSIPTSSGAAGARNGHIVLDTFSPVNQYGSFEFDRVLKSGEVQKRTRKTKTWKTAHLVLRPNLLSVYKKPGEVKLHRQLNLSDLTAVAYLKDPKRDHVFGLFSPSKNYHLQAQSEKDAHEWVEFIRKEARIEEEEEELFLASPKDKDHKGTYQGFERHRQTAQRRENHERLGSSSPEPSDYRPSRASVSKDGGKIPLGQTQRQTSFNFDYSGNELGSYSDFSDGPGGAGIRDSTVSLPRADGRNAGQSGVGTLYAAQQSSTARNVSHSSGIDLALDEERVVWHGQLLCLTSKGGVRRWKSVWAVLRSRQLALYKNKDEYSAILLIPLSTIINAVEIDPISKSKAHCMQIILPNKTYRFCAPDEEALMKWLGALKSLLARRKEAERKRAAEQAASTGPLMQR
ncbi:MAG: hypothetical protein M1837_003351 [Sclerophora amabilis]|nr:MAG: hypothetical protein M1837_003351 [Sclerophora amabilis]